jgi:hypothetical protein
MMAPEAKSGSETARAISGAVRFCGFDPAAVKQFDPRVGAALRSFLAALYGLPLYAAVLALDVWTMDKRPADLWAYALAQAAAYVFHTLAFPLAVFGLMRPLGPVKGWPLFVTVQNWFGLLQAGALLYFVVIAHSGILGLGGVALLVLFQLSSMAIEAYIAMVTLGETALAGCAIVLLDVVLGAVVDQWIVTQFQ